MKKYGTYSVIALAIACVLSACMSPAEKEFRTMSAVQQMADVQNLYWTESQDKLSVDYFASFGQEPIALYNAKIGKSVKSDVYDLSVLNLYPFFNANSPVIHLPGLDQWTIEKVEEKENTFRLKNADQFYVIDVVFDPQGRLSMFKMSDPRTPAFFSVQVKAWEKVNSKEFPSRTVVNYSGNKKEWKYSWKYNLPENEVQKIIEDNKKQSNNNNVKERSNP